MQPASSVKDARLRLSGYDSLSATSPEYVERPAASSPALTRIVDEAEAAAQAGHPFNWFFTGHTGAGKSTELARLTAETNLRKHYLPWRIDIKDAYDVHDLEFNDILHALALGCLALAKEFNVSVSHALQERLALWGSEVSEEQTVSTTTEGQAGIKLTLGIPFIMEKFATLGEEIKSGGEKRKTIRRKLYEDITGFIRLIDDLAGEITASTQRLPLIILDGLDHVDYKPCAELFTNYYQTLTKPKLAKLFVVPLGLMGNQSFRASGGNFCLTLPNVKVFPDRADPALLDETGYAFYREVISRRADLTLFDDDALRSIFRLSAGLLRDMIRLTGLAAGYARDAGHTRITAAHSTRVWDEVKRDFYTVLTSQDFDILRKLRSGRDDTGVEGLATLLHLKAVIFYPNGMGWYGIHPAVAHLLKD